MRSGADTTLQAAVIQADTLGIKVGQDKDGNTIDDTARLNLIGVKESTLDQTGHDRHSFVWDNIADQGVYQESLVMPEIHLTGKNEDGSPTQPDIQTPGGYTVGALALAPTQYEIRQAQEEAEARAKAEAKQQEMLAQLSGQPLTLTPKLGKTGTDDKAAPAQEATPTETPARQKAKTLIPEQVWQCTGIIEKQCGWVTPPDLTLRTKATELAKQPGLEWLADLAKRDDVDWQKVELATKDWDYHHAGLTPEGAAIVVIVVTILTWGSASSAAAGAAEGAGMTTAAGTTGASTVMVGEGVALTTTGAAVSAGVTAGLTTLASQAAVSLINHQGDIGETLKDLGSKESVKQVVAAMLSAGLAQGATTALNLPNPATNTAFVDRFRTYATQATVKAGIQSLVFGTPLEETAKAALVSSLAQSLTAEVGDWGVENKLPPGSLEKMLAHAVVQCAAASALGQDCGAGALGGAIAEALAPIGDQLDQSGYAKDNKLGGQLGNAIASMSAMLVASLAGQDSMTASAAASMVDSFNRQLHPEEKQRIKQLANGDAEKEARLTAAACAMVKCYAEYPVDSTAYNTLKAMADAGATFGAEQQQLSQQQGMFGYTTTGIFSDQNMDTAKRYNNTYQLTTRAAGAGEAVLGGLGVAGSVATAPASCATGVGCVANAVVAGASLDALYTGSKQVVSGQSEDTMLNQALQDLGLSPEAANYAEFLVGVGAAAKVGGVLNAGTEQVAKLGASSRQSYEDISKFGAKGVDVTPGLMNTQEAQAIVREYQAAGMSRYDAEMYARQLIQTGTTLPTSITVEQGTELIKVVPKTAMGGDAVSSYTPFFVTRQEFDALSSLPSEQIAQRLGLPAEQSVRGSQLGFDVYAMTPKSGNTPTVFISEVAPVQQGTYTASGGAQQVLVPNRTQWNDPVKVGSIGGTKS